MTDLYLPRLIALAEEAAGTAWRSRASVQFRDNATPHTIIALIRRVQAAEAELLTARKVVEAARRVKRMNDACQDDSDIGFNKEPSGPMAALDEALSAYDAATSAQGEGDRT